MGLIFGILRGEGKKEIDTDDDEYLLIVAVAVTGLVLIVQHLHPKYNSIDFKKITVRKGKRAVEIRGKIFQLD